jgi:hypothetical protein
MSTLKVTGTLVSEKIMGGWTRLSFGKIQHTAFFLDQISSIYFQSSVLRVHP